MVEGLNLPPGLQTLVTVLTALFLAAGGAVHYWRNKSKPQINASDDRLRVQMLGTMLGEGTSMTMVADNLRVIGDEMAKNRAWREGHEARQRHAELIKALNEVSGELKDIRQNMRRS